MTGAREIRVTRRYRFAASHRLHSPVLSDEDNRRIYGKCNNPFGHGHDYTLEVALRGPLDPETGRLVPLELLDRFVETVLLGRLDRRNLNIEIEEFAVRVPTTENLAAVVMERLQDAWSHWFAGSEARLASVRIHETKKNIIELVARDPATGRRELSGAAARVSKQ